MGDPDKNTFQREREIFFAALDKVTEESRAVYLEDACGDDEAMLARVREMLENHSGDETETFLTPPGIPAPMGTLLEGEGDMVGNYKLVETLGEGGFGVVWMAEQEEPVQRKVALKLIKPGMDSAEVIARFGAERQALAVMDHPNIAKVFDAGATESGRPYFVMELSDGVPITEFCDREKLTTKARLELFAVVCGAVQHAHQKAVIHRDLKPSNILVVDGDDGPVPKVIDFGIAKAIGEDVAERTAFTAHGQLVGTPQYMSPEQAGMGGAADIDTRSDVYSLGVVLYELLAGSPPFDVETLRSAGFEGMCRIIREEEPMRPSIRLGTASRDDSTRITGTRVTEPQKLSRQVRGELDWIVMKAIEKDRGRRYETANAFAADIGRYLNDEPVQAAAPSASYRFRKFARRNKAVLGTAALVASVLIAATGVSVWQAVEAHRARVQSDKDREEAEGISEFMVDVFQSPDPARDGRTITVAEMLDAAAKKLETDLADQPGRRAKLQATLAKTYLALGQYPEAVGLMEKVRNFHLATSGKEHPDTLVAMANLANSYSDAGRLDEALEMGKEVLVLRRKLLDAEHPKTLIAMNNLATSYHASGRREEALEMWEEVLAMRRKVSGAEHPDTLMAMGNLALSYSETGRLEEALQMQEELLPLYSKVLGPEHPETLEAMNNLAVHYTRADRLGEAILMQEELLALRRKVLGAEHPGTLNAMNNLAVFYFDAGRREEALEMQEEVLALRRRASGAEHPDTIGAMGNLALSYHAAGRLDEALEMREEVLALGRKVLGAEHPDTIGAMGNLALSYHAAGRLDEALEMREKVLALYRKVLGDEHPETLHTTKRLAMFYFEAGLLDKAGRMLAQLFFITGEQFGVKNEKEIAPAILASFQIRNAEIPGEEPSGSAIADYYELNKGRFGDTSIHLLMLSASKFAKKRDFMETLQKELAKGGDFAAAAREHSDDSAAAKGGDRGWVKRGYFAKELDTAAFALKAGDVSGVIEDATHFRILKVVERKEGTPLPLDEVREMVIAALKEESRKKRVEGWIEEAKKELAEERKVREKEKTKEVVDDPPSPPLPSVPSLSETPGAPDPATGKPTTPPEPPVPGANGP